MIDSDFITALVPAQVRLGFARLHEAESLQLLRGLGYLLPTQHDAEAQQSAIAAFRVELQQLQQTDAAAFADLVQHLPYYLPALAHEPLLSMDEVSILQQLTSLEGGFHLRAFPSIGLAGLHTRVIAYRLRSLGLPTTRLDDSLRRVAAWIGETDLHAVATLLGDIAALAQRFLAHTDYAGSAFQHVLYLHAPSNTAADRMLLRKAGQAFQASLQDFIPPASYDTFQSVVVAAIDGKASETALADHIDRQRHEPLHGLLLRALQVQLACQGMLDDAAAATMDETWAALRRLLDMAGTDHGGDATRPESLWVHVGDGMWAINVAYFFHEVRRHARGEPTEQALLASLCQAYGLPAQPDDGPHADRQPTFRERLDAQLESLVDALAQDEGPLFVARPHGLLRLFGWIRQRVDDFGAALEQLFSLARGGVQGILHVLMRGFDRMARCLEAIRQGGPIITQTEKLQLCTDLGPGMDPITHFQELPSAAAMATHAVAVCNVLQQWSLALARVGALLRWGIALGTTPMSWIQIGVTIARLSLEQIGTALQKNS